MSPDRGGDAQQHGHRPTPLTLRLVDADEPGPPRLEAALPLNCPDPLGVHNVRYQHPAVFFERARVYRLRLWAAGRSLCESRLLVSLRP